MGEAPTGEGVEGARHQSEPFRRPALGHQGSTERHFDSGALRVICIADLFFATGVRQRELALGGIEVPSSSSTRPSVSALRCGSDPIRGRGRRGSRALRRPSPGFREAPEMQERERRLDAVRSLRFGIDLAALDRGEDAPCTRRATTRIRPTDPGPGRCCCACSGPADGPAHAAPTSARRRRGRRGSLPSSRPRVARAVPRLFQAIATGRLTSPNRRVCTSIIRR